MTKEQLKELASREHPYLDDEDCVPDDYAGGNIDDAANWGFKAGRIALARELTRSDS